MAGQDCDEYDAYKGLCVKIEADAAFLFLGFLISLALLVLTSLVYRTRVEVGVMAHRLSRL